MNPTTLQIGSVIRIEKPELQAVIDKLKALGYRTIGPRVSEAAIIYDDLHRVGEIPIGFLDEQDGGKYRLQQSNGEGWFDYTAGPYSLKNFLFPSREAVLEAHRVDGDWRMHVPSPPSQPLAVIGPRACDLHALRVQDRVFLGDHYVEPSYKARREQLFVAAVNCRRSVATCFCHSMNTGPRATFGFDLSLTELVSHFVIEIGTEVGACVASATRYEVSSDEEIAAVKELSDELRRQMEARSDETASCEDNERPRQRSLNTAQIRDLLMNNLEHPRWGEVAQRCLACGNCTLVCPTCFCSSVEEVSDLTGDAVRRERSWASCFTEEHSYMSSGAVRKTTQSRYRQWLTHKLATWQDQFGTSGCVGCGRCITWCPVGIDITEEVQAIRGDAP